MGSLFFTSSVSRGITAGGGKPVAPPTTPSSLSSIDEIEIPDFGSPSDKQRPPLKRLPLEWVVGLYGNLLALANSCAQVFEETTTDHKLLSRGPLPHIWADRFTLNVPNQWRERLLKFIPEKYHPITDPWQRRLNDVLFALHFFSWRHYLHSVTEHLRTNQEDLRQNDSEDRRLELYRNLLDANPPIPWMIGALLIMQQTALSSPEATVAFYAKGGAVNAVIEALTEQSYDVRPATATYGHIPLLLPPSKEELLATAQRIPQRLAGPFPSSLSRVLNAHAPEMDLTRIADTLVQTLRVPDPSQPPSADASRRVRRAARLLAEKSASDATTATGQDSGLLSDPSQPLKAEDVIIAPPDIPIASLLVIDREVTPIPSKVAALCQALAEQWLLHTGKKLWREVSKSDFRKALAYAAQALTIYEVLSLVKSIPDAPDKRGSSRSLQDLFDFYFQLLQCGAAYQRDLYALAVAKDARAVRAKWGQRKPSHKG